MTRGEVGAGGCSSEDEGVEVQAVARHSGDVRWRDGVDRWRAICDSGGVDGWPLAVESSFYVVGGGRPASRAMVAGEPAQSVTERVTRRETSGAVI